MAESVVLRSEGLLQVVAQSCPNLSSSGPCSHWLRTVKERGRLWGHMVADKKNPCMLDIEDKTLGRSGLSLKTVKGAQRKSGQSTENQKDGTRIPHFSLPSRLSSQEGGVLMHLSVRKPWVGLQTKLSPGEVQHS